MKRLLALIISVFLLLSTFLPFCFADYSSSPRTLWDKFLYKTCQMGSFLSAGVEVDGLTLSIPAPSANGWFNSHLSAEICANSSDNLHHADSLNEWQGNNTENNHGSYAYATCKYCGKTFKYYSDDLKQDYNDSLHDSGLDNGLAVTPSTNDSPSGLFWTPSFDADNIDIMPAYENTGYYPAPSPLFQHFSFPHSFSLGSGNIVSTYSFLSSKLTHTYSFNIVDHSIWYYGWLLTFSAPLSGSYHLISASFHGVDSGSDLTLDVSSSFSPSSFTVASGDDFSLSFSNQHSGASGNEFVELSPLTFSVVPDSSISLPSVPSTITINNNTYPVVDIDFNSRTVHVTDDRTIIYDDDKIIIKEGDTVIEENYYIIEDDDPGTDPGNGDDSSTSQGGGTVDPGDASGSGGSGCCEQCALLLRQVNSYLLQIQTLVDQINDKLGPESDNYMEGIYNLLVEINSALDNLPTEPHKDYEAKLTTISNQLANIWGDLDTIKTSLSAVQTNTATTNQKLDTVHADLQAVLAELQTQRGILNQILSVLREMLGHITSIDSNVEVLASEEDSQNFFDSFILKFHFIGDIFSIIRQLFADITNDAATVTFVDNGDLPIGDLSNQHFPVSGSPVPVGTAPQVLIKFPSDTYHGADLSGYSAIDMSWYAPYKSRVDALISGFLWIGYLWLLFKRAPGIVRGAAMIEETNYKIEDWKNGG